MKVIAIIQARMSSTRLPGKVLLEAAGKPLILHMLERISQCTLVDGLWLATSEDKSDDPLEIAVEKAEVQVFRGSLDNVLSRFWHVGKHEGADVIVRLTGDCPLHDPQVVDAVIDHYMENRDHVDYVSNVMPPTFPDGLDTEVFSFSVLDSAYHGASSAFDLEHVTPYIRKKTINETRASNFSGPADFSHFRWTLDEPEDYEFIKQVYDHFYYTKKDFGWLDVLSWITKDLRRLEINSMHLRNAGAIKSVGISYQAGEDKNFADSSNGKI